MGGYQSPMPDRGLPKRTSHNASNVIRIQRSRRGYRCSMPEAVIARKDYRLGARPHAQLVEQIGRVIAHRLLTNQHAFRYVGVAQPFGDKPQ